MDQSQSQSCFFGPKNQPGPDFQALLEHNQGSKVWAKECHSHMMGWENPSHFYINLTTDDELKPTECDLDGLDGCHPLQ